MTKWSLSELATLNLVKDTKMGRKEKKKKQNMRQEFTVSEGERASQSIKRFQSRDLTVTHDWTCQKCFFFLSLSFSKVSSGAASCRRTNGLTSLCSTFTPTIWFPRAVDSCSATQTVKNEVRKKKSFEHEQKLLSLLARGGAGGSLNLWTDWQILMTDRREGEGEAVVQYSGFIVS